MGVIFGQSPQMKAIYIGGETVQEILKLNKNDLSLVATSAKFSIMYSMISDQDYLYIGGDTTYGVRKLNKSDLSPLLLTSDNYGGIIRAMTIDEAYIYIGGPTTQTVRKLNNLTKIIGIREVL